MPIIYDQPLSELAWLNPPPPPPPPRVAPEIVEVFRREPHVPSNQPDHTNVVAHPSVPMGDPFNARNVVHSGDFFARGKIRSDPGTHLDLYTNIRGIRAIAEQVWGFIAPTKVRYIGRISYPQGQMRSIGRDVNIDTPNSISYGELATVQGYDGTTIKGVGYA